MAVSDGLFAVFAMSAAVFVFKFLLFCAALLLLAARFLPPRCKRAVRRGFAAAAWTCLAVSLLALLRYWLAA
ncbi:protein MIGRI [Kingella potus]|uniref:protein MIGRI n=2 Tax=Kingella potus TaxID=265175 RepID=UPI000E1B66C0